MRAGGPGSLGSLTERQVAEPLASYWTYGLLRPALRAIKVRTREGVVSSGQRGAKSGGAKAREGRRQPRVNSQASCAHTMPAPLCRPSLPRQLYCGVWRAGGDHAPARCVWGAHQ